MAVLNLFSAQTSNAAGTSLEVPFRDGDHRIGTVFAYGTWDGATFKVQESPDDTNWFDIPDATLTADGTIVLESVMKYVRGDVSGVGTSSINAGFQ